MKPISIIFTQGAPGSGKSTWAREQVENAKTPSGSVVVLTRDDFRTSVTGGEQYKYTISFESLISSMIHRAIESSIKDENILKLIIADTNLNPDTVKEYHKVIDRTIRAFPRPLLLETKRFEVPWKTLVERNHKRGIKAVPLNCLRDMFSKMDTGPKYVPNLKLPKAIIVDLDGTLADNTGRSPFKFDELNQDAPVEFIVNLVKLYYRAGYRILCVIGRPQGTSNNQSAYKDLTKQWLNKHNIPFDHLFMRKVKDHRSDDEVKREILINEIQPKFNVEFAVDDRQSVVDMWRFAGVKCLQCNYGDF